MAYVRDLRISIIGAGMGGLAAALALSKKGFKNINVYETASDLGFLGAGIQIAPNLVRILDRLNCWKGSIIERDATNVKEASICDGRTNNELAHVDMPDIEEKYGYPHCTGHRASLARSLYEACQKEGGIKFNFGLSIVDVLDFTPGKVDFKLRPRSGDDFTVETDVLLASDGIKSPTRYSILRDLKLEAEIEDTGQAAYRIMLKREEMSPYPELLELLDADGVKRWIGEKRHLIAYPISGHSIYNISTCQPDQNFTAAPSAMYTTKGSKAAMKQVYHDFCPLVQTMLDLVPEGEVCEWRLRSHKELPTWTNGSVALVGDACHPTLPHLSQGAAMAIEDGATLAEVISRVPSGVADPAAVAKALKVYELLRKPHTTTLVDLAAFSGRTLHLGEGKAKEERDRQFALAKEKGHPLPDKWASPDVQKMICQYDCLKEAGEKFDELYASLA